MYTGRNVVFYYLSNCVSVTSGLVVLFELRKTSYSNIAIIEKKYGVLFNQ